MYENGIDIPSHNASIKGCDHLLHILSLSPRRPQKFVLSYFSSIMKGMHHSRCLALLFAVLLGLFSLSSEREIKNQHRELKHGDSDYVFNHTLAITLAQYSSAVYTYDVSALFSWTCPRCTADKIKDFEMVEVIVDIAYCLQAFIGVDHNLNAIIIAFRGTQMLSIRNWIEDILLIKLDLDYPGLPGAKVHSGFYASYHNTRLRPAILSAILKLKNTYGNFSIIVTGHSLGGALASFCALDLVINSVEKDVQLMTFGQPRVGNAVFATSFNKYMPKVIRMTHQNDIVPHLPPYSSFFPKTTFRHFSREVWLHEEEVGNDKQLVEQICDDSGEDPTCSRSVYGNSVSDHLDYYGLVLTSDGSYTCKLISTDGNEEHNEGVEGDIRLSRNPNPTLFRQSS
ncbi:alpha/beta-Hydrolases superfamily protein [Rhynchospora pubera]|uniref:Alpha/beta-Hydrolases superfamily protein n=1 Tax=Rhynchospora pubera TaxID=906938 RepID=A0AAV8F5K3_9POAL|nr:alpha/beta-Hydrolases superfamily protein [Rhynchospora pubera]